MSYTDRRMLRAAVTQPNDLLATSLWSTQITLKLDLREYPGAFKTSAIFYT